MAEIVFEWQIGGQAHDGHVTGDAPAIVGREAGSAVHVESPTVSRKHAQVRRRADGFVISDLTSGRNPVIVNNRTIDAETAIAEGDTVQLGNVTLRVTVVKGLAPPSGGPTMKFRWEMAGQTHSETVYAGDPVVIGRDVSATIVIPSPTVSRQHARIAEKGGRFVITDLTNGRNPVMVDQKPLSGERYLSPGDVINLGEVKMVIVSVQGLVPQYGISELRQGRLVVCSNCHREVDGSLQDCPWCGTALVNSDTVLPRY